MRVTSETAAFEREAMALLSRETLWAHLEGVARWQRVTGTAEEMEAGRYVAQTLEQYGAEVEWIEFPAYVSLPGCAALAVTQPTPMAIECITHAFGASTGPAGLEAELVYVGSGDPGSYRPGDVAGRIALADGLGMPHKAWALEQAGAAGQVYVHGEHIHELIVTTIWGTPTPESASRLPRTPVVSIRGSDGARLKAVLDGGLVRVRLVAETWTGWRTVPIVIGTIPGAVEPDRFLLLSCHLDSWYHGAMDNGAANAIALELVRILSPHRDRLRRSLRVAFWPGHSNARYAGSTWYADHRWEELHDGCVVHVNIESPGAMGSVPCDELVTMPANRRFAEDLFLELTDTRAVGRRFGRTGEQSFWGAGIPALFVTVSMWPSAQVSAVTRGILKHMTTGGGELGLPWWWHTPHDTIDKIDPALLARDARVYLAATVRLCNAPVLPFDHTATADDILEALSGLQAAAGDRFDLREAAERAHPLREASAALKAAADAALLAIQNDADAAAQAGVCRVINDAVMAADRALVPVCFTAAGPFDHDPAVPLPPLPGLSRVRELASLDPTSDQFGFLLTRLVRERTRLLVALREATSRINAALARVGPGTAEVPVGRGGEVR